MSKPQAGVLAGGLFHVMMHVPSAGSVGRLPGRKMRLPLADKFKVLPPRAIVPIAVGLLYTHWKTELAAIVRRPGVPGAPPMSDAEA